MRNVGHPSLFIFTYGEISPSSYSSVRSRPPRIKPPLHRNLSRSIFPIFKSLREDERLSFSLSFPPPREINTPSAVLICLNASQFLPTLSPF